HLREQRVAVIERERAGADRAAERDLDIDLEVGGVDAGRIVDGVGVETYAAQASLDAAPLGHAEIGTLADHLAMQLSGGDADRIVGAVADLGVAFVRGANI